jgi:hypothetical protein
MDIHHAWCDLKPGVSDLAFSEGATKYLSHLGAKNGWLADHTSEALSTSAPMKAPRACWLFWATSSGAPPKRK